MLLKNWLELKNMEISKFAEKIGVEPMTVRRYNSGDRTPRAAVMKKIMKITEGAVTPNDFYDAA